MGAKTGMEEEGMESEEDDYNDNGDDGGCPRLSMSVGCWLCLLERMMCEGEGDNCGEEAAHV